MLDSDPLPAGRKAPSPQLGSANQARVAILGKVQPRGGKVYILITISDNGLAGIENSYSFSDVADDLSTDISKQDLDSLLVVYFKLSHLSQKQPTLSEEEEDSARQLVELLAKKITNGNDAGSKGSAQVNEATLACLCILTTVWKTALSVDSLIQIAAFTNPSDPWVTDEASSFATAILSPENIASATDADVPTFITRSILQDYLRPIFSKATTRVTSSGRPTQFPDPSPNSHRQGVEPPAWKKHGFRIIPIFRWAVNAADAIANNWFLFAPVLLALVEDADSSTRQAGLEILATFIRNCPLKILQSTGIGTVFQEAIFPSLLYLPSLTPEEESVPLIDAAYQALLALAQRETDPRSPSRRKLLDKVFRDGVFTGYFHASEYMLVVETLMKNTTAILDCLEVYSVKHLQNLLPMFSSVITDPFIISRPTALLEAVKTLNACLRNCWPRISSEPKYTAEVIRIISICWLNLYDGELASRPSGRDLTLLTDELRRSADIMHALSKNEDSSQLSNDLVPILQKEPRLSKLFSWVPNGP
ncbi:unnamed protein product [Clonostachys byssicola]|uniref:Uncharacterized protein n=1 Tax=Clonostachys byssicola TaxID=160290 RepID=A0A9N9U0E5_9HYPO|nr:unnamed protein product [Clonostachys byssicola]